jgi:hypothetical protein
MKAKPDVAVTEATLTVEVRLTDAELKSYSKELADAIEKRSAEEAQLETFKAQRKAEIARYDAIIGKNTSLVSSEKEFRSVRCRVEWDFDKGTKVFYRKDTGESVREMKITDEERQLMLQTTEI